MMAAIIVGIIIAGILVLTAFTSQDIETSVSPSEEPVDITPPSAEPTQGRQLHLEFNESVSVSGKP